MGWSCRVTEAVPTGSYRAVGGGVLQSFQGTLAHAGDPEGVVLHGRLMHIFM